MEESKPPVLVENVEDFSDRVAHIISLAVALQDRFEQLGSIRSLDTAIALIEGALSVLPADHPYTPTCFNNLGVSLRSRFECTEVLDDLNRAMEASEEAVKLSPHDHPQRAGYLMNLALAIQSRSERLASTVDLGRAIDLMDGAVTLFPEDHPDRPICLNNLGSALQARFKLMESMTDLNRAIEANEEAVRTTPNDDLYKAARLNNLGTVLQLAFTRLGSIDYLTRAIDVSQEAVNRTPSGHPARSTRLTNLGIALQMRFDRLGDIDDLKKAISIQDLAVTLLRNDHPQRAGYLNNLALAYQGLFERENSMRDVDRAIEIYEEVLELTPIDSPDRASYLQNFGFALETRFKQKGLEQDLERAISVAEAAVEAIPRDHSHRATCLNTLGNVLQDRFERKGTMHDLNRAISIKEEVVKLTPIEHMFRGSYLRDLGGALLRRSERTGSGIDLDLAITANEEAISSMPLDFPERLSSLHNLGVALRFRFEKTAQMSDLNRAVSLNKDALDSIGNDHPHRGGHLGSFGCALTRRFEHSRCVEDLDQAIAAQEEAVVMTPPDVPDRIICLVNLGVALQYRFQHLGSMQDLDRAIIVNEEALMLIPDDHPNRALCLTNLAAAYQRRYEQTGSLEELERAIAANDQAFNIETAPPTIRIKAAQLAANLLGKVDLVRASCLLKRAVELLPSISPRTLNRTDQQHNLSNFVGLASDAASYALETGGSAFDALQLLEIGRGVMASLYLEVRSELTLLEELHPALAVEFKHLRDQIDAPETSGMMTINDDLASNSSRQHALVQRFDSLVRTIRELVGFERFLLGPSQDELEALAVAGPIVVFNICKFRSDAILVTCRDIRTVNLPGLKYSELTEKATDVLSRLDDPDQQEYLVCRKAMKKMLGWLWDVAVSSILDELGFTVTPPNDSGNWPRVWWVGGGWLTVLPIHAAGYHKIGSRNNVLDRVISSYTPTIKALAYAQEKVVKSSNSGVQCLLIVGMPRTPDQDDLPYVEQEIQGIEDCLSSHAKKLIMQGPDKMDVVSQLRNCQIAHFACHGQSFFVNPSQSCLLLNDWKAAPLSVAELAQLNLKDAQLAYLSACRAAQTRNPRLLDEAIHVAAGFQLAGFPYVIGTLWQIIDKQSADFAKNVYNLMLGEQESLDVSKSAKAVHQAMRLLRDQTRHEALISKDFSDDPIIWAPYIHLGL